MSDASASVRHPWILSLAVLAGVAPARGTFQLGYAFHVGRVLGGWLHADSARTVGLLSWGTLGCLGFCGLCDGFCEVVESDAVGEQ